MAIKEFVYKGKSLQEIKQMGLKELALLFPSRIRRSLQRDVKPIHKSLLKKLEKKDHVKTHCRDMVVIPAMIGKTIHVYQGKEFMPVRVEPDMIGHFLGEFIQTRKKVQHSAPGIGATRSSAALSVK